MEISRLFDKGSRLHTPHMMIIVEARKEKHDRQGRVAFIAGKKNGNAVWRNSAKRRMRAIYRDLGLTSYKADIGMVAKRTILSAPYLEVLKETESALNKDSARRARMR